LLSRARSSREVNRMARAYDYSQVEGVAWEATGQQPKGFSVQAHGYPIHFVVLLVMVQRMQLGNCLDGGGQRVGMWQRAG
jgi:hypothetical protein